MEMRGQVEGMRVATDLSFLAIDFTLKQSSHSSNFPTALSSHTGFTHTTSTKHALTQLKRTFPARLDTAMVLT